jgi:hypothetical protein
MAAWQALGESVLGAVRAWADPRERELRKRRRARRRTIRYSTATGVAGLSAVGMAVLVDPAWTAAFPAGVALVFALPAVLAARRYNRMQRVPLPAPSPVRRALPPANSSARAPMTRLSRAEHSLAELYPVIERSALVPADELAETMDAAATAAVALRALGDDVVAMERARVGAETAVQRNLDAAVATIGTQLDAGVAEYEDLLRAAARMATPISADTVALPETARLELRDAADRLDGWAEALAELAQGRPAAAG